jgi:putative transposase
VIDVEKANFPVSLMCGLLGVSRSGYYAWRKRPPSLRSKTDAGLVVQIRRIFDRHRGRYGSPRIHDALKKKGVAAGRHRVARVMRENEIVARRKKRRTKTTDSSHGKPVAPNILERDFEATAPNQKWTTDITYLATLSGWLFLAVVLDLFSRRIVGWALSKKRDRHLALSALEMATSSRRPSPGVIHHSDQGSEYASDDYQTELKNQAMVCSMSRKGNCWDNAPSESFFGALKSELPEISIPQADGKTRAIVFEYLEGYYNRQRSHSSLGYLNPMEYEEEFNQRRLLEAA